MIEEYAVITGKADALATLALERRSAVFYLYVVPLVGLILGTVLAELFPHNQLYVILGAILGLALGFLWVKGHLVALMTTL